MSPSLISRVNGIPRQQKVLFIVNLYMILSFMPATSKTLYLSAVCLTSSGLYSSEKQGQPMQGCFWRWTTNFAQVSQLYRM